jgi:predicted transcriptional regulator
MRQSVTGMRKSNSAALIWILKVFSQERYFDLVRVIAKDSTCTENNLTSKEIMDELNLTRRQFNFRISRLTVGKLVKKVNNKYSLTEFGEESYNAIKIIENATRVQARITAMKITKFSEYSVDEEMDRIINSLIHSVHLGELITQTSLHQRLERS